MPSRQLSHLGLFISNGEIYMTLSLGKSATTQPPVILWFRKDLRLSDNPALQAALKCGQPILPLFIFDDQDPATKRLLGGASRWWLHKSLRALQLQLPDLCLRRGNAKTILLELMQNVGATQVFMNRRYGTSIDPDESLLEKFLQAYGIKCHVFKGNLLSDPATMLNQSGKPYQIFSSYWNHCLKTLRPERPSLNPQHIPTIQASSDELETWNLLPLAPNWATGFEAFWTPGEAGAHERLGAFVDENLVGYPLQRNFPAKEGTSRLSPHLHWGEISPNQIWHVIQAQQVQNPASSNDSHIFLAEIGWREFAYYLAYHFPHMSDDPLRPQFKAFPWRYDYEGLEAWQKGLTGYPIVDAGMRELWHKGWMHNRVRMIVASFLVKHLLIPWQDGERWFWDTLVDADLASNAMNWQWAAGCGVDAAPYFRIFNPTLQAEKFDPEGAYIRLWVPELKALPTIYIHKPWQASVDVLEKAGIQLGKTYPHPIVDHAAARARALGAYQQMKVENSTFISVD